MHKKYINNFGFGALTAIIMITPIILVVISGSILASRTNMGRGINHYESLRAKYAADRCTETGLLGLKNNPLYAGETISFDDAICTITMTEGDSQRTIRVTTTVKTKYTHILEADLAINESGIAILAIRE